MVCKRHQNVTECLQECHRSHSAHCLRLLRLSGYLHTFHVPRVLCQINRPPCLLQRLREKIPMMFHEESRGVLVSPELEVNRKLGGHIPAPCSPRACEGHWASLPAASLLHGKVCRWLLIPFPHMGFL